VGEQRVELVAHVAAGPLGVGLPAGHALHARRALERERLREPSVDDQRRFAWDAAHGTKYYTTLQSSYARLIDDADLMVGGPW
jgi:hypothetical protein